MRKEPRQSIQPVSSFHCFFFNGNPFRLPPPRLYTQQNYLHSTKPSVATVSAALHVTIVTGFIRGSISPQHHYLYYVFVSYTAISEGNDVYGLRYSRENLIDFFGSPFA